MRGVHARLSDTRQMISGPETENDSDSPNTSSTDHSDVSPDDLTGFRRDVLTVLASGDRNGYGVKRALEKHYSQDVNASRVYTALGQLADDGLVAKSERDGRENRYEITDRGGWTLRTHYEWMRSHLFSEYYPGGVGE